MKLPLSPSVAGSSARKQATAPSAEVDAARSLIDGVDVRYSGQRSVPSWTATTNRTVLVVTHDRDLAAFADRVATLARPVSRGWPGGPPKYRTRTRRRGVNTMGRIVKPVMWGDRDRDRDHDWDRKDRRSRRFRSRRFRSRCWDWCW
jgi:hypothetical protein